MRGSLSARGAGLGGVEISFSCSSTHAYGVLRPFVHTYTLRVMSVPRAVDHDLFVCQRPRHLIPVPVVHFASVFGCLRDRGSTAGGFDEGFPSKMTTWKPCAKGGASIVLRMRRFRRAKIPSLRSQQTCSSNSGDAPRRLDGVARHPPKISFALSPRALTAPIYLPAASSAVHPSAGAVLLALLLAVSVPPILATQGPVPDPEEISTEDIVNWAKVSPPEAAASCPSCHVQRCLALSNCHWQEGSLEASTDPSSALPSISTLSRMGRRTTLP